MPLVRNIARNALRRGYAAIMVQKVLHRWKERGVSKSPDAARDWCRRQQRDLGSWMESLDPGLAAEAATFRKQQKSLAEARLAEVPFDLGGGGAYDLLYLLVKLLRPRTVVETGVAAGFSSRAILTALMENGQGELHSSDFPYFRVPDPERFIGYIVEPDLRKRWTLFVKGDAANLPKIVDAIKTVDLLHYDSDKTYAGRDFALQLLQPRFHAETLIVFDDIQDNQHFQHFVERRGKKFLVFEFEGKWVGMTGGPDWMYSESRQP